MDAGLVTHVSHTPRRMEMAAERREVRARWRARTRKHPRVRARPSQHQQSPATSRRRTSAAKPAALARAAVDAAGGGDEPARHHADAAEQIRMRAYFLHLERGRPGNPMEDWLAAERELRGGDAHDA